MTNTSATHLAPMPLLTRLAGAWVMLAFPCLLVMLAVRLVMTPLFLQAVYNRPGFPPDPYGFSTQDRLRYAPGALDYLLNAEDIRFLERMQFPNGLPLYNTRELRHMRDVKIVTQAAFQVTLIASALTTAAVLFLASKPAFRPALRRALLYGSLLTLAIIAAIVLVAVVNWNTFFTAFHQMFFESGTWRFQYSDTLIRLFPEQFWFEAALVIGSLCVIAAALVFFLAGQWRPRRDI